MTRVYALWKQMSGHTASCFRALTAEGAEVRILHREATPDAPFDDASLTDGLDVRTWKESVDDDVVARELEEFEPEILFVCSWNVGAYRRSARRWRGRALRIVMMDNQWMGTPKQWGGRLARRAIIAPAYDAAFVPGERQAVFARHLGFRPREILSGVYSCEESFFTGPQVPPRDGFLFIGRLVGSKGVDVLASAYRAYYDRAVEPWPLRVVGTGPMAPALERLAGVEMLGFMAPSSLPALMAGAGCLVLPSRFEPWGVVVHEATASGMAVICTDVCGASTRLVLDGYNGRVVGTEDSEQLTLAMRWIAEAGSDRRASISSASTDLAAQF
ncbi:MAG: glycosyltransferase family 4 protein, partial [Acidimicrobiales bacterium]